jgi:hypothetical protein
MEMNTDKQTTYAATVKIVIGMIAVVVTFMGHEMNDSVREAILALAMSGYLVFSWLQGFWTNKATKPIEEVKDDGCDMDEPIGEVMDGGEIPRDITDNEAETMRINEDAELARLKEGRGFLDPAEQYLSKFHRGGLYE